MVVIKNVDRLLIGSLKGKTWCIWDSNIRVSVKEVG